MAFVATALLSVTKAGAEMPEDFLAQMAIEMSRSYCSDVEFLQCMELNKRECENNVKNAVSKCDFEPMWNEFERRESAEGEYTYDRTVNEVIGNCIGSGFQQGIRVSEVRYGRCMIEHAQRMKARIQKELGEL